jgi:hypothetical protein
MRRREFISLLGGAATAWPLAARAPQAKVARIGALYIGTADAETFKNDVPLGNYFEAIARQSKHPKTVANWIINNLRAKVAETNLAGTRSTASQTEREDGGAVERAPTFKIIAPTGHGPSASSPACGD